MEAIFASTYEPVPTLFRRPSVDSLAQSSTFSSAPSSPRPASPADDSDSELEFRMDEALAKETIGLPIFISAGNTTSTSSPHNTQNAAAALSRPIVATSTPTSSATTANTVTTGKKLSQLFSVARTSLDSLVRKSATFLLEEADDSALVIEWRWETAAAAREQRNCDGNALLDKDGWVEGWLD